MTRATVIVSVVWILWAVPSIAAKETLSHCQKWNTKEFFGAATVEDVKACLEAGADPNARNKGQRNYTPLHWAAGYNEEPGVIQALLTAGADPNKRSSFKFTPLHMAAESNGNPEVIQVLVAAGAAINARDKNKFTPLHLAAASNVNPAVIQALLAAGAGPAAKFPFIQALLQLDTTEKKLAHLRSWRFSMAKEQGISRGNAIHFGILLHHFVFHYVDDKGVLDCEALGQGLWVDFRRRYVMFNAAVDDLCPYIPDYF